MSQENAFIPRLRTTLDFMPSPIEDRPGLVLRDPFQFSKRTLIIPPQLLPCLEFFDGTHTPLDLREFLVRMTGDLQVGPMQDHLTGALSEAGFLEDDNFARRKEEAERAFAEAPQREPAHAGSGYPDQAADLTEVMREYMTPNGDEHSSGNELSPGNELPPRTGRTLAIAAPHVSPFGGVEAYRAAYAALDPSDAERTFVVLGTSHYGQPERLGLTRKSFVTPFGETSTDLGIVERLAREAGPAAVMEDYCHAVEHSIEFQVVYLQHLFGPRIKVVPVLCGAFAHGIYEGHFPEQNEEAQRALGALSDLAAREGDCLLWVLGVDMAHMGRRYGDPFDAEAGRGEMERVTERDLARIARIEAGDAAGFWELVKENQDDLKWCGSAPIYTLLKILPAARARALRYQQWNIDEASVVSFAGMRFHSS
ncbi:MAG TPA: AmmeMemoRadiSam system protein B [Bryobacteraceae bacterium]|nr:AmmeMemoRadiSam system protein B [Bryobacteraceae bacterium]